MFAYLLLLSITAIISKAEIPATEEYPHREILGLEGKMVLYWKFNDTHIIFEVIK